MDRSTFSLCPRSSNCFPRMLTVRCLSGCGRDGSGISRPRSRLRGSESQPRPLVIADMGVSDHSLLVSPNKPIELVRVGRGGQEQRSNDLGTSDSHARILEPLNEGIESLGHDVGQHERPVS